MSNKEKVDNLVKSGNLPPLTSSEAAQILLALHQQNLNQSDTNKIIFKKLDDAAQAALDAKDKAKVAADGVIEIKDEFKALNGKVQKTIDRVASLEGKEETETRNEEKKALIKKGMKVIPTKIYNIIVILGNILLALLAFGGAVSAVWWLICLAFNLK